MNSSTTSLEKRITRLEAAVFGSNRKKTQKIEKFVGPSGGIKHLIHKNFFASKRSLAETRSMMSSKGYHYSAQSVDMALNRLSKKSGPLVALREKGSKKYVNRR